MVKCTTLPSCWAEISPEIRKRLGGYGVHTLADWRRLPSHRRGGLFGITRQHRELLDAVARGAA